MTHTLLLTLTTLFDLLPPRPPPPHPLPPPSFLSLCQDEAEEKEERFKMIARAYRVYVKSHL